MVCLVLHAPIGLVPLQAGELVGRTHWGHKVCSSDKPEKRTWKSDVFPQKIVPPLPIAMFLLWGYFCFRNNANILVLMYFCCQILSTLPLCLCWCISVDILQANLCQKSYFLHRSVQTAEGCFQWGKEFPRMPTTQIKNVRKLPRMKSVNIKSPWNINIFLWNCAFSSVPLPLPLHWPLWVFVEHLQVDCHRVCWSSHASCSRHHFPSNSNCYHFFSSCQPKIIRFFTISQ